MEKYLSRCLNSLLVSDNNLLQRLEVIVVNDGSKDSSLRIALEYERKFSQIFRVINKQNGNYGSCVNKALDIATGRYFRILDADDFFDTNALEQLLKYMLFDSRCPDLIISNYREEYASGKVVEYRNTTYSYNKIYDACDVDFQLQHGMQLNVMHRITYRLQVLKSCKLKHLEGISYTDTEYCFYPMSKVSSILFVDYCLYCYQIGREGQTVSIESYRKNIHHLFLIIDRMIAALELEEKGAQFYKKQLGTLRQILTLYYSIILTGKFTHDENIVAMEKKIYLLDKNLYHTLGKFKYLRIVPVIAIWRKFHIKPNGVCFQLIYKILRAMKRL